tara:strand:- start:198 stop:959 length:762 start_codon:yes stop_codon:yes gene_type:complete
MKNCWIITSAIGTKTAPEKTVQRWHQTIHTVDSIIARDSNCKIHILDTGANPLPDWSESSWPENVTVHNWQNEEGSKKCMNDGLSLSHFLAPHLAKVNPDQKEDWIRDYLFFGYIKSVTESWAILKFLKEQDLSEFDYVFKISGRYFLTPSFNIEDYKNKFTFKKQGTTKRGEESISSVQWAFDTKYHEEFTTKFEHVRECLLSGWHDKYKVQDLECNLRHSFANDETTFIKWLGVAGIVNDSQNSKPTVIGQ